MLRTEYSVQSRPGQSNTTQAAILLGLWGWGLRSAQIGMCWHPEERLWLVKSNVSAQWLPRLLFNIYRNTYVGRHRNRKAMWKIWKSTWKGTSGNTKLLVKLCEILAHFPLSALLFYDVFFLIMEYKEVNPWVFSFLSKQDLLNSNTHSSTDRNNRDNRKPQQSPSVLTLNRINSPL